MIPKAKEYSQGMLGRGIHVTQKPLLCCLEKYRRDSLLNGVEERDKNFKYVKNAIKEKNLKQIIRYRFPKHETIDHLENVIVFDLETYNGEEFAEAYANLMM